MSVKTSGAEFKRYYNDDKAWPRGWWHEDEEITINGIYNEDAELSMVADTDVIVIKGGVIFEGVHGVFSLSMESHFKKWRKAQATEFLVVEVAKDKTESVIAAIVQAGAKVVR